MDKKELQKKLKNLQEELAVIISDIDSERKKGNALTELYRAQNNCREKISVIKSKIRKCDEYESNDTGAANNMAMTLTRQGTVNIRPVKTSSYSQASARKKSSYKEGLKIISPPNK